ncbi:MAG: hypothetical protein IKE20_07190 [Eggerthellaceae bacterium]|nr:hypothetical protein [Eggerthellaceae bacterium]
MIELNEPFWELDDKFYDAFQDRIPLRMIPSSASFEELKAVVEQSIAQGKNLLPGFYGYGEHRDRLI